jgi:hypothetical protein
MANLLEWIAELSDGESVEGVVIGGGGWSVDMDGRIPTWAMQDAKRNKLLTFEEAKPLLDYEFNSGYGAPECNAITVWTKSWVIAVSQYDGSTSPFRLPRNPIDHVPDMPGG